MERYFIDNLDVYPESQGREVIQTLAVQRVLQRAIFHVQSAEKPRVELGDFLASVMEEEDSYATYFLKSHGLDRLDLLEYISHGQPREEKDNPRGQSFLERYTQDLVLRAQMGLIDPLIGREEEIERTIQILSRRRKKTTHYMLVSQGLERQPLQRALPLKSPKGRSQINLKIQKYMPLIWGL